MRRIEFDGKAFQLFDGDSMVGCWLAAFLKSDPEMAVLVLRWLAGDVKFAPEPSTVIRLCELVPPIDDDLT